MIQTLTNLETETNTIELPSHIALYITQKQFAALVEANPDLRLRLERTAQGALIVNPPLRSNRPWRPGWETGEQNRSLTGQLARVAEPCSRWYENNKNLGKAFDSGTGLILPNGATSPMLLG